MSDDKMETFKILSLTVQEYSYYYSQNYCRN